MSEVKAIVLDIEGTVISISFVKDVLFPYARENLRAYLKDHWNDDELRKLVSDLQGQVNISIRRGAGDGAPSVPAQGPVETVQAAVEAHLLWQMDRDRKTAPLKAIQGLVWTRGYQDGHLRADLYADVIPELRKWKAAGKSLFIYSSGSTHAQKLLFSHTTEGDITGMLNGHFDITTAGPKTEAKSYEKITDAIGHKPCEILFLTDIAAEARAAAKAGIQARLVVRPGNAELSPEDRQAFSPVESLEALSL
ncbi:unnamed protein product [Ixodes hexagonus]